MTVAAGCAAAPLSNGGGRPLGGATFVQLREKELDQEAFIALAKEVKQVTSRYHVPFVINDNVEVALAVNADGVHVGQEDMAAAKARRCWARIRL